MLCPSLAPLSLFPECKMLIIPISLCLILHLLALPLLCSKVLCPHLCHSPRDMSHRSQAKAQRRQCSDVYCSTVFESCVSEFCNAHRCSATSDDPPTGVSTRCYCNRDRAHTRKHGFMSADGARRWKTSVSERVHHVPSSQRRTSVTPPVASASTSRPRLVPSRSTQHTSRVTTSRPSEPTACRVDGCNLQPTQGSEYCSKLHRCRKSYRDWDLPIKYRCVKFHSHKSSQYTYAIYSDSAERAAGNASTRKSSVVISDAAATVTGRRGVQTKNPTPRRLEKRERCGRSFCTTRCAPASSFCEEHDARCSAHFCRLSKTAGSNFCDKHRCPTFAKRSGSNLAARCEHRAGWRGRPCSACLHR